MAEFLTTKGTSSKIEEIIIHAKKEIFLVSPFLQLSKIFYERLKEASDSGIRIKLVYGKDELKPNERNSLAEIKGLELYFFENLHAKCYFNENRMVITSMNMYEFSEINNREMGVFIDSKNDTELYENAKKETLSIIRSAKLIKLNKPGVFTPKKENIHPYIANPNKGYNQTNRGFCIRCGKRIPLDPARPYCNECFSVWAQWENVNFQETHCHLCGELVNSTMIRPLCYNCVNEYQRKYVM